MTQAETSSPATIDRRTESPAQSMGQLLWLVVAVIVAGLPHYPYVMPWVPVLVLAIAGWRVAMALQRWRLPGTWIRGTLTILAFTAVLVAYRQISGLDAGSSLLLVMVSMKLLETRGHRDRAVVVFICYFLLFAAFLREQAIWSAAYLFAGVVITTACLYQIARRGSVMGVGKAVSMLALVRQAVFTDTMGSFQVRRLPARLPAHQRLVLLLSHPGLEPTVVPVPQRGSPVAATAEFETMVAHRIRTVRLIGLPSQTNVTLFEEVQGLPAGSAVVRRSATTDLSGVASFMLAGRGKLWLRIGPPNNAMVDLMVEEDPSGNGAPANPGGAGAVAATLRPAGQPVALLECFRPLQPLAGSNVRLVNSYRHLHFEAQPIANAASSQALHAIDELNWSVAAAEVFAVSRTGPRDSVDVRFLGFTSLNGVMSLAALRPGEDVVVIGRDGSIGWVHDPAAQGQTVDVRLRATGRALLHPSLRPAATANDQVVTVTFRRELDNVLPGLQPVVVRFASEANGWEVRDVPPGRYRVTVGVLTFSIEVPSGGFVELQPQ